MTLISVSEAAIQLGVSAPTVRRLCKSGDLPSVRVGKLWKVDADLPISRPIPISQRHVHPVEGPLR